MKNRPSESALQAVIEEIVRSYVTGKGGSIGYKETPYANQQGTNPTKNGRPFDLLLEIDSRLLMLEVKVQIEPHKFNALDEKGHQMRHLDYLWEKGVKVYYGFNLRTPCPDYWDKTVYPDRSVGISQIAGINPAQMRCYIKNEIKINESDHSLKVLLESDDGGDALPKVLHDWMLGLNESHTATYLIICYNTRLELIQFISPTQFKELVKIFQWKPGPRNIIKEIPSEIIEKVRELREAWDKDMELNNDQSRGGRFSLG